MRKLLIICLFILIPYTILFGQSDIPISKGHFMAGGIVSFNTKATDSEYEDLFISTKLSTIEISPDIALFVLDKLAVGIQVNSIFSKEKYHLDNQNSTNKKYSILLSPYVRYYFFSGLFGETAFGYGFEKYDEVKGSVLRGRLSIGYSVFLNDRIALEPIISQVLYKYHSWSDHKSSTRISEFNFSLGLRSFF